MSIIVKDLTHIYNPKSPFETMALRSISFEIETGEFTGLIGHTGSGKSTLIQHLNGLLKAESGTILINGLDITGKNVKMNDVRKKVGLVFQYPEYQLFEETVEKDVAFGPGNLGLSEKEVHERTKEAIETVGLDFEEIKDRSPFELSGGQRRRVAIAGIIAMKPEVLILDEPTAGLDPRGRREILEKISLLHKKHNTTVLLISHSMEDIARLCGKVLVINKGSIAFSGTPKEVFSQVDELENIDLGVPQMTALMEKLGQSFTDVNKGALTVEEAKEEIMRLARGRKNA
jgi:energy-coupling factor transport system ATP-binding protein